MIIINHIKEIENYKEKEMENKNLTCIFYSFDDDVTFNIPVRIVDKIKCFTFSANNIIFNYDADIDRIGADNINSKSEIRANWIHAKNIEANLLYCDDIHCDNLKARYVESRKIEANGDVECEKIRTNYISFFKNLSVKNFLCHGGYFENVKANNSSFEEDD